jgi:tetratricopeptide (TPR) repeat protein
MMTFFYGFHALRHFTPWRATGLIAGLLLTLPMAPTVRGEVPVQKPESSSLSNTANTQAIPAIALTPEELGDLAMARKRYQAALEAYHQVSPSSATVWNKIGIANQQLYMTEEARKSYEVSLKMDRKNPDVINNLGTIYYSLHDYGYAERLYRKALKLRPKSALIYKNLGTDLLAQNKFKKGWTCYQTALLIDPEVFERTNMLRIGEPTPAQKRGAMSYYLAKSYVLAGMNDLAVGYLRMAIDDGFADRKKIMADKEFASLHGVTAFERLLSEQRMQ